MNRYTPKELRSMNLKALEEVGESLGLKFDKHHTKADRARRILQEYASLDLATNPSDGPSSPAPLAEPSPGFERLIDGDAGDAESDSETPQRGGARPGAGRPAGMTNDLSRLAHLSQQPHPVVQSLLEGMFQTWATAAKCPDIALTKVEAIDLALPWTQTLEYMGVTDHIPAWLHLGTMTLWTSINMLRHKAALARDAAKRCQERDRIDSKTDSMLGRQGT